MKHRGFTLIELLVVIAIIAVLAAILFPVFARAREQARKTTCLSNLQQVGRAVDLYSADYSNFLVSWSLSHPGTDPWTPPPVALRNVADPSVLTWDVSIQSYLRDNQDVLRCPSNPYGRMDRAYSVAQYTQRPYGAAGVNQYSLGGYKDSFPVPTDTVLLFEKGDNPPGAWGDALGQNVHQSHNDDWATVPANGKMFHANGKNFLFIDGHSKWFPDGQGPFGNQPQSGDTPGVCQDWGKADDGGDWPSPD